MIQLRLPVILMLILAAIFRPGAFVNLYIDENSPMDGFECVDDAGNYHYESCETSSTGLFTVNPEDVHLYFYPPNGNKVRMCLENAHLIRNYGFNDQEPTVFLVHGYLCHSEMDAVQLIKKAYHQCRGGNVFIIDYKTHNFPYATAVGCARNVALNICNVINAIEKHCPYLQVHIIGHSLGAHIASFIANCLKKKPYRITGLDPAGPLFTLCGEDGRLDSSDAEIVDIIHTSPYLGLTKCIGHRDFYANGGKSQPGCLFNPFQTVLRACDHNMAFRYYAYTVCKPYAFPAENCTMESSNFGKCNGPATCYMGYLGDHCDKNDRILNVQSHHLRACT